MSSHTAGNETSDRLAALADRRRRSGRGPAATADNSSSLRPAAHHRGAPDVAAWANPTIWLAVATVVGWAIGWGGYLSSTLPWWLALAVNSVATYFGFTVFHESVHRTAHRNRRINDALGVVPAWMLGGFTYPLFRVSHLNHHAHTNDPERDPDHWVAKGSMWLKPLVLITTGENYRRLSYRHGWVTTRQKWTQIVVDVLVYGAIIGSIPFGLFDEYMVVFMGPALVAGLFLFWAFDYLPHYPFDSRERFYDTRVQPGRLRHAILLGQNYHLIHHLWVTVPWFKYRQVFRELEPELRKKNIRID